MRNPIEGIRLGQILKPENRKKVFAGVGFALGLPWLFLGCWPASAQPQAELPRQEIASGQGSALPRERVFFNCVIYLPTLPIEGQDPLYWVNVDIDRVEFENLPPPGEKACETDSTWKVYHELKYSWGIFPNETRSTQDQGAPSNPAGQRTEDRNWY